jgi:hypothetical protein
VLAEAQVAIEEEWGAREDEADTPALGLVPDDEEANNEEFCHESPGFSFFALKCLLTILESAESASCPCSVVRALAKDAKVKLVITPLH